MIDNPLSIAASKHIMTCSLDAMISSSSVSLMILFPPQVGVSRAGLPNGDVSAFGLGHIDEPQVVDYHGADVVPA